MSGGEVALLLVGIVGSALLSVVAWRVLYPRLREVGALSAEKQVDILLVLLVIAAFAMGVFLSYALLLAF